MGTSAALIARPAGWPGDDVRRGRSLRSVLGQLRELTATAAGDAALFGFGVAVEFAARVEEAARALEYLQLVGAEAVDRTRKEAAAESAPVLEQEGRRPRRNRWHVTRKRSAGSAEGRA